MTKHLLTPAVRIQKARTTLLLDHPFFGSLLFRLGGQASGSIQTMATDGVSLFYNPAFVETLNAAELAGVLAHEVMHPALQHHTRRGKRDQERWNMACDYAINPLLLDAGLTLPKDVLIDHRFRGMSAERIYNLIEEQQLRRIALPDYLATRGNRGALVFVPYRSERNAFRDADVVGRPGRHQVFRGGRLQHGQVLRFRPLSGCQSDKSLY